MNPSGMAVIGYYSRMVVLPERYRGFVGDEVGSRWFLVRFLTVTWVWLVTFWLLGRSLFGLWLGWGPLLVSCAAFTLSLAINGGALREKWLRGHERVWARRRRKQAARQGEADL